MPVLATLALSAVILNHPGHVGSEQPDRRRPPRQQQQQQQARPLPDAEVSITVQGAVRVIRSNGLPNHEPGTFPNAGNPNAISAQNQVYRVPATPVIADTPTAIGHEFGIALNGVVFEPFTAEFWTPNGRAFGGGSDWNYEALGGGLNLGLDAHNAHVQPTGKYHYHGVPTGLVASEGETGAMTHVGWAGDGFPIYAEFGHKNAGDAGSPVVKLRSSYQLKEGTRPGGSDGPGGKYEGTYSADWEYVAGSGDLDECNGREGVTPEFPEGTYYYVITEEFPNIPRFWRGTPDRSWLQHRGERNGQRGNRPERPKRQSN